MSDEQDRLKLSLEPPKLFGRKKKSAAPAEETAPKQPSTSAPAPEPATQEHDAAPEATERATSRAAEHEVFAPPAEPAAEPVADTEPAAPEPAPEPQPDTEPVTDREPTAEPVGSTEPAPESGAAPAPEPVVDEQADVAARDEAADRVVATDAVQADDATEERPSRTTVLRAAAARAATKTLPRKPVEVEPEPVSTAHLEDAEIAAEAEKPLLTAYQAAVLTGVVVGAAMVVLTWLSLRGCEAVRGTASCGGGPGFLLLVATFVVSVLLGSALLRAFTVPDPGSSSFLAVGLVAVVALLFLIDVLDHWSMLVVIPVIAVGAYLASVWVTKTFVEPGDPRP